MRTLGAVVLAVLLVLGVFGLSGGDRARAQSCNPAVQAC